MKRLLLLAAAILPLAACQEPNAVLTAPDGGPVNPAVLKIARARCNEQYSNRYATETQLYGQFGDYVGLIDDAKACMLRQGVRVVGFRQPDGRIEAYPNVPKWATY